MSKYKKIMNLSPSVLKNVFMKRERKMFRKLYELVSTEN